LVNLSRAEAVSGVEPSTRFSFSLPGTAGSARRDSTSVSASGGGSGAFGDSGALEVAAGNDESAESIRLAASCEHPVSDTVVRAMTAASVTQTFPDIQRQAQLAAK
jgi:hypothetical protein